TLAFETQKLWPLSNISLPDFFHRLPGVHQSLYWRFPGHMVWYPLLWMLSIWFWRGLQGKKPCLEAWFRAFLIPVSILLLSTWVCFLFLDFEKSWHLFCFVLGAMGAFAILNQSYIGGIVIYCTNLFHEDDIISIPDENIYLGEVISIGFIRTKIKVPETAKIRSIPNKRFLSISVEKTPSKHSLQH
ncbi:MAG: mechanosensitive ion channel, partial [Simkania sp.]|nr:mechanosensitive ion channel [Simkania sp.]